MKTKFIAMLLIVSASAFGQVIDGEYSDGKKKASIIVSGDSAMVSLYTESRFCSGATTIIGKVSSDIIKSKDKDCRVTINSHGAFIEVIEQNCNQHHGNACTFGGILPRVGPASPSASSDYQRKAFALAEESVRTLKEEQEKSYPTEIYTIPDKRPVIINSEFIGVAPLRTNIRPYLDTRKYSSNLIKANPGDGGRCVAVEIIKDVHKPPRRILLDTRLCPIGNDINVHLE